MGEFHGYTHQCAHSPVSVQAKSSHVYTSDKNKRLHNQPKLKFGNPILKKHFANAEVKKKTFTFWIFAILKYKNKKAHLPVQILI